MNHSQITAKKINRKEQFGKQAEEIKTSSSSAEIRPKKLGTEENINKKTLNRNPNSIPNMQILHTALAKVLLK